MIRKLRVTTAGVSVIYTNGNYTNNLIGNNFAAEIKDDHVVLIVDLAPSFRVRNKSTNTFYDANELADDSDQLESLTICDDKVPKELKKYRIKHKDLPWKLRILLDERGEFEYSGKVKADAYQVMFIIDT